MARKSPTKAVPLPAPPTLQFTLPEDKPKRAPRYMIQPTKDVLRANLLRAETEAMFWRSEYDRLHDASWWRRLFNRPAPRKLA